MDQIYVSKRCLQKEKKNVCVFAHFCKKWNRKENKKLRKMVTSWWGDNREESGGLRVRSY